MLRQVKLKAVKIVMITTRKQIKGKKYYKSSVNEL